jgi:hypothetical protein
MCKGAQTAAYVIMAHFLWCTEDNQQKCIDAWTGSSTALCVIGIVVYSWFSQEKYKVKKVRIVYSRFSRDKCNECEGDTNFAEDVIVSMMMTVTASKI